MAGEKREVGAVDAVEIRRIGVSHAAITPPRQTTVIDVARLRRELQQVDARLTINAAQRAELEARRADLSGVIAQFDGLPIDRLDSDPVVPLPAPREPQPEPEPAEPGVRSRG